MQSLFGASELQCASAQRIPCYRLDESSHAVKVRAVANLLVRGLGGVNHVRPPKPTGSMVAKLVSGRLVGIMAFAREHRCEERRSDGSASTNFAITKGTLHLDLGRLCQALSLANYFKPFVSKPCMPRPLLACTFLFPDCSEASIPQLAIDTVCFTVRGFQ